MQHERRLENHFPACGAVTAWGRWGKSIVSLTLGREKGLQKAANNSASGTAAKEDRARLSFTGD